MKNLIITAVIAISAVVGASLVSYRIGYNKAATLGVAAAKHALDIGIMAGYGAGLAKGRAEGMCH